MQCSSALCFFIVTNNQLINIQIRQEISLTKNEECKHVYAMLHNGEKLRSKIYYINRTTKQHIYNVPHHCILLSQKTIQYVVHLFLPASASQQYAIPQSRTCSQYLPICPPNNTGLFHKVPNMLTCVRAISCKSYIYIYSTASTPYVEYPSALQSTTWQNIYCLLHTISPLCCQSVTVLIVATICSGICKYPVRKKHCHSQC